MKITTYFLTSLVAVVLGCGGAESTAITGAPDSAASPAMDAGPSADAGPVAFTPRPPFPEPGQDAEFAPARARCQVVVATTDERGGESDSREIWTYDDEGNLVLSEFDQANDGTIDRREARRFLMAGQPDRLEVDDDGDGVPDTRVSFAYEDDGTILSEHDQDADGVAERSRTQRFEMGRLVQDIWRALPGGAVQVRQDYEYDASGRPVQATSFEGPDQRRSEQTFWRYDSLGRLVELGQDQAADGVLEQRIVYDHDDLERTRVGNTLDQNGESVAAVTEVYDGRNRLVERLVDLEDDGTLEESTFYEYAGDVLSRRQVSLADGTSAEIRYDYDLTDRITAVTTTSTSNLGAAVERRTFAYFCRDIDAMERD